MVSHHRSDGENHCASRFVACTSEIGLLEVGKPFNDFLRFCIGEEYPYLAFYLLDKVGGKDDK